MLRKLGVRFVSGLSGKYGALVNGKTEVGGLTRRVLGGEPAWTARGNIEFGETVNGKQKLKISLIPDESSLRMGAKGPLEATAEIEEKGGKINLTHVRVTQGLANLLGKELDVSGMGVSDLKLPLSVESSKEMTKILGTVSANDLETLPSIIRKMVGMFSNPLNVSAELSKTEEVASAVQPAKK